MNNIYLLPNSHLLSQHICAFVHLHIFKHKAQAQNATTNGGRRVPRRDREGQRKVGKTNSAK